MNIDLNIAHAHYLLTNYRELNIPSCHDFLSDFVAFPEATKRNLSFFISSFAALMQKLLAEKPQGVPAAMAQLYLEKRLNVKNNTPAGVVFLELVAGFEPATGGCG